MNKITIVALRLIEGLLDKVEYDINPSFNPDLPTALADLQTAKEHLNEIVGTIEAEYRKQFEEQELRERGIRANVRRCLKCEQVLALNEGGFCTPCTRG